MIKRLPKREWPRPTSELPSEWNQVVQSDPIHDQFLSDQFEAIKAALNETKTYDDLIAITATQLPFHHRMMIEDEYVAALFRIMRLADNATFIKITRDVQNKRYSWIRFARLNEFVTEEMEMRYLILRMEKMLNEE